VRIALTTDLLPVRAARHAPANYGRRMQDRELVAAITAGDADGLGEAYDRYALPLYTYCRFMLPDPDPMGSSAEAVQDTFIIAAAKVPGLTDPDRLRSWLHAVARNECLRRRGPQDSESAAPATPPAGFPAPEGAMPPVVLPDGLRDKVMEACADNSPTGRAYRTSVIHRAGPFGRNGFPRPAVPSGPRWWHDIRRRPRAAAAVAAAAGAVVLGGIVALLLLGSSHQTPTAPVALGGGVPVLGASSAPAGGPSSPTHKPGTKAGTTASPVPADGSTLSPGAASAQATVSKLAPSSPASSPASPSPSSSPPSSSPPPAPGKLTVTPAEVKLTAAAGKVARGTFRLGAVGGPVTHWVITVPAAVASKVTLSRYSGSLTAGDWVLITVSVQSKVAVDTRLTVSPGDLTVTVVLKISA
jgi:DNA-directed RNA polymerase specialized sigma24 family protein